MARSGRAVALVVVACTLASHEPAAALAQNRGVYPLGMSATNSGVTPGPGFTYANQFLFYARNESKDAGGAVVATGSNSVLMDMNSFVWVSGRTLLGGARYSVSATLPIANNSLASDAAGSISGGGGFADSYYQPLILGWRTRRVDVRAIYGFLAPTGRFDAGASDNVGSGYWTHVVASGQTFYLTSDRRTAVSAFQMYEFHGTQEGTDVRPGQNFDLDWSVTRMFPVEEDVRLQVGLAGYGQWQTTDRSGPTITPEQAGTRYAVNALGVAGNLTFPQRKAALGFKYFGEFSNRSTFQGYSLQISGSLGF